MWRILRRHFVLATVIIFVNSGTALSQTPQPNTGELDEARGTKRFYSHMVEVGLFDNREPKDLLRIWNGQYKLPGEGRPLSVDPFNPTPHPGSKQVNELFGDPLGGANGGPDISGDDAEWEVGAFTVANYNNTDADGYPNDDIVNAFHPYPDFSTDPGGVVQDSSFPLGTDEVDLIKMQLKCPDDVWPGMTEMYLAVDGYVVFWREDTKETLCDWITYSHYENGLSYYRIDEWRLLFTQLDVWLEVLRQSDMNGIQISFLRDDLDFYMPNPKHEFDRVTITGIWADAYPRTTQGVAKFKRVYHFGNQKIAVEDCDALFLAKVVEEDATVLIYDRSGTYNRPYVFRVTDVRPYEGHDPDRVGEYRLALAGIDQLTPFDFINWDDDPMHSGPDRPLAGAEVRIGPHPKADKPEFIKLYSTLHPQTPFFQGKLGVDNIQTGHNGIEIGFKILPVNATEITLPSTKKLLNFDVTRQKNTSVAGLGLLHDKPTDDGPPEIGIAVSDEDNFPNDGWIFSLDTPGLWPSWQIHPNYGAAGVPPDNTQPIGTEIPHKLRLLEFVRVQIEDDFPHAVAEEQELLGSRCSDKLMWKTDLNGTVVERVGTIAPFDTFRWLNRADANSIGKEID